MEIYNYKDYKQIVLTRVSSLPKRGRGEFRRLAQFLGVSSAVVSQVFRGARDLTLEQALKVAQFFGLGGLERDYFLILVQIERAGTHQLKEYYTKQMEQILAEFQDIKTSVPEYKEMTNEAMATFYSNWYYTGIRILSSIDGYDTIDDFAKYFDLSRDKVDEVVGFLLAYGLCVINGDKIEMGVASTYLKTGDKYLNNHRKNWRLKGMNTYDQPKDNDMFFGSVCSLSMEDAVEVKKELLKFIKKFSARIDKSDAETVACLNIDWFGF